MVLFAHCDTKSLPSTHGEPKLILVFKMNVLHMILRNLNLLPKGFGIVQRARKASNDLFVPTQVAFGKLLA